MVRERAPKAIICLDAFHVVSWAMKALDKVRVRTMTTAGVTDRHAMWATRKNPPDLTTEQRTSLASIAATNKDPLPRVSAERTTTRDLSSQRQEGSAAAGRVAVVGVALAHPRVRRPGPQYPPLPRPDLQHPRPRPVRRPTEATNTHLLGTHQARLRIPQPRRPHRHGPTHPRRPLLATTRPRRMKPTHGNVGRSLSPPPASPLSQEKERTPNDSGPCGVCSRRENRSWSCQVRASSSSGQSRIDRPEAGTDRIPAAGRRCGSAPVPPRPRRNSLASRIGLLAGSGSLKGTPPGSGCAAPIRPR